MQGGSPLLIPISPNRGSEIQFLTLKISRLEQDYNDVNGELQRVRTRLRKAEDFEIKYEMLHKQKLALEAEMQTKDRLISQLQTSVRELEIQNTQSRNYELQFKHEKDGLLKEIQQWRLKFLEAEEIASHVQAQQQYKMTEKLSTELQLIKKQFFNTEEDYRSKIRVLEISLAQKQALESVLRQKSQKHHDQKDTEIQRLQNNLTKLRQQHLQYSQEKNAQLKAVADRFEQLFTHEIEKLKSLQQTNNEKFSVQVEGLKGLLELKNTEINQLIAESNEMRKDYLNEKTELLKEISLLKEKLYQVERESQLELFNLKQRLMLLHKVDVKNMQENFQKINLNLEDNVRQLEELIKKKDKEISELNEKFQQRKGELEMNISQKDQQITELQENLRHTSDINAKEIDNLHSSFHKITTEKGQLSTQYQSTFTFLNTQITKLTSSNELKNQEIKELHLDISEMKKNFSEHVKDLQKKWRLERKERQEERMKEREMRQSIEVEFREKEQKWRHRQRILERDKEKEQRQKIKQKVTIEQLQATVHRLTRHVKENQQRLKQQMQRNQSSFVESGSIRRQLTGQLQRQRTQFQAIKKMQIDQVHRQYQIEIGRLTNENQKLMNELTEVKINLDRIQEEYQKLTNTKKNAERINKEKAVEYERKMAALNAEINLTQNLYNSFMSAKSKVVKKPSE